MNRGVRGSFALLRRLRTGFSSNAPSAEPESREAKQAGSEQDKAAGLRRAKRIVIAIRLRIPDKCLRRATLVLGAVYRDKNVNIREVGCVDIVLGKIRCRGQHSVYLRLIPGGQVCQQSRIVGIEELPISPL